ETMEAIFGLAPGTFEGTLDHWIRRVAPDDRDAVLTSFGEALKRATDDVIDQRVVRPDGSIRSVEAIARVLREEGGNPIGMIGVATDVTDRKDAENERARLFEAEREARAAAEATQETLEFLASASALLAESLDYRSTLARVARLAVPRLADWCSVEVPDDQHQDVEFVVAHVDPEKVELAHEFRRRYPADPSATRGVPNVMRTGRSELIPVISDEVLQTIARDDEHLAVLRGMGMRSAMIVPLIARGRTIGAVSFLSETEGLEFGEDDLRLVEELARRAAIAIDNARLYRDRSHVARTLQESLLPPRLPKIPGIEIAARYRFAGEGNEIGGDFYDLFETADGAWAIVMGDACGKGPEAAAITGLARHSVRAAAVRERTPSRVLALLNESILGQVTDNRFLTAAYARLEPGEGHARMTISCGGHPPAMIVRASGKVDVTSATGTLVGILPEAEFTDERIDLAAGDAVVLYTDGVVEARRGEDIFGEDRLRDLLATCTRYDARGLANAVRQAVGDFQPGVPHDDMAILVLRVKGSEHDT
ncbi:MAG TPA: SpoIIE family protein phosphatase, partial [Actinomycetota bacterium]|nr:SpoIIE family protein phosphatase [Actinomycetota bacterium]